VEASPIRPFPCSNYPVLPAIAAVAPIAATTTPAVATGVVAAGDRGQPAVPGSSRYSRRDDLREEQMGQR